jgi:hypothetical protein
MVIELIGIRMAATSGVSFAVTANKIPTML